MDPTDKRAIITRFEHDLITLHGNSATTARVHAGAAKRWWLHTGSRPFDAERATTGELSRFLDDLEGTSPETYRNTVTAMRHFYRFANTYGLCDFNPAGALYTANSPRPAPLPTSRARVITEWELSMERRGLAAGTIEKRTSILRRWWQFVGDPFGVEITWRNVERFIDELDLSAANSRYAHISHLHQFYTWARRYELCAHDPTELVERPRTGRHLPRPITDTDLALAVALADDTMRAALLLAAGSGLRCVEMARLRWDDIDGTSVRLRGKGDKERVIPLHPACRDALDRLDRADAYVLPWRPSLTDQRGGAEGGNTSRKINLFLHSLGIAATAHQLRHWCATQALRNSGDLRAVQELLGHSSPATTAIYTKIDASHLDDVVARITVPMADTVNTDTAASALAVRS